MRSPLPEGDELRVGGDSDPNVDSKESRPDVYLDRRFIGFGKVRNAVGVLLLLWSLVRGPHEGRKRKKMTAFGVERGCYVVESVEVLPAEFSVSWGSAI